MKSSHNTAPLKWIWSVSGKAKLWVLLRTLIRTGQGFIAIFYAHALGNVVDSAASGNKDLFTRQFVLFLIYTVASIALLILNRYLLAVSKHALDKAFRLRVFSQLLTRNFSQVSQTHNGEWMNRIISDTEVIAKAIVNIIPEMASALVRICGAVFALYRIVPQLIYILVPGGLLMAGFSLLFQKKLKLYHKKVQHMDGKVRSFMQERLYSLTVIHAFTQESATQAIAKEEFNKYNAIRMRRHHLLMLCVTGLANAMIVAQLLGVGLCGLGILKGTLTYGTVSTVLYLVNMLEYPISMLSEYVSQYYAMLASAERLLEIEAFAPDSTEEPKSEHQIHRYYKEDFYALGIENGNFSYEEGEENTVLRNFSMRIEKGEYVAFTGESGCGKSTTLKILLNLYPLDGGSAYLQNNDGTYLPLDTSWRGLFAYVPQGNQLISGTIRESLTFCDPELMAQDEKLYQALRIACADTFVRELPNGLDSPLGERGCGLSEGQVQRLSVARALLTERPILMLDEATSALDGETEKQLLKNLRAMTDRTVLLITHREAALDICDKQILFEKQASV